MVTVPGRGLAWSDAGPPTASSTPVTVPKCEPGIAQPDAAASDDDLDEEAQAPVDATTTANSTALPTRSSFMLS
jgi:hypothetical protein